MALSYGAGARLGMVIQQVKEDWRVRGKVLIKGNEDDFIRDVAYLHAMVLRCEQAIFGAIGDKKPSIKLPIHDWSVSQGVNEDDLVGM